jgi:hypothetical protein
VPYLIAYQRQHREHYRNSVTLAEENVASGVCMFSRPGMPVRKLGHFRAELTAGHPLVARITSLIMEHKLNEKPVSNVRVGPGSQTVWIQIRDGERWTANSYPALAPLPEPLAKVEEVILAIFAETARQPLRSLAFGTEISGHRFRGGQEFAVKLTASNDGKFTTRFLNPASGAGSVSFFVWLAKEPKSDDEDTGYVTTLQTKGLEFLKGPHEVLLSGVDQLELAAGKSLAASVHFRMPKLDRGAFQLQLVYNGMAEAGGNKELVLGGYHGDPIDFQIE